MGRYSPKTRIALFLLLFTVSTPVLLRATEELNCAFAARANTDDCCFSFSYDYNFPQNITSLETRLLNPGVYFSGLEFDLASGWQYEVLQQQRRLRWSFAGGNEIPAGEQVLFAFCLSGWNSADTIELAVFWRTGELIAKRDTLRLACTACWEARDPLVECQADSSYSVQLDFFNQSGFSVDFLSIREPAGQDLIVEETITPANPIPNNSLLTNLNLQIRPEADGLTEVCFEITPRHILAEGINLDCCTASYCLPLPECDRCCTPYSDFEMAVEAGFAVSIDCDAERISLQANELNDCDRVNFTLSNGAGGIVDGNEVFSIGGLAEDNWYEACMTVTRQNRSGDDCFMTASLTVCDSFFYDCLTEDCLFPEQIDLDFECPPEIDLVCGCDSMTYLNACAAENWAGLAMWEEDRRCNDEPVDEIVLFVDWIVLPNEAALSWTVGGLVNYRYFLVQRMLPDESWLTLDIVDGGTFSYTDLMPAMGLNKYRVVGVLPNGKVVFSNEDFIVDNDEALSIGSAIRCWPNPVHEEIYIQFPINAQIQISLWDFRGRLLANYISDPSGYTYINQFRWPPGPFLLTAILPDGTRWQKRIIKS